MYNCKDLVHYFKVDIDALKRIVYLHPGAEISFKIGKPSISYDSKEIIFYNQPYYDAEKILDLLETAKTDTLWFEDRIDTPAYTIIDNKVCGLLEPYKQYKNQKETIQ